MAYVDIACRFVLGVVFVVSAWSKLKGRSQFATFTREVRRMGVPHRFSAVAARLVAAGEVAVPLLLAIPWLPSPLTGYAVAIVLLASFTVGIIHSLRRGDRTPCNCFGRSAVPLGWRHVFRNLALAAVALVGIEAAARQSELADVGVAVVAALAGAVIGGLVTVADDLTALLAPSSTRRRS